MRAEGELQPSWSHFSELELLRFTAEEAQARGIGIAEVQLGVEHALMHSPEIVQLTKVDGDGGRHYTTPEMLAIERRMIASVMRSRGN